MFICYFTFSVVGYIEYDVVIGISFPSFEPKPFS